MGTTARLKPQEHASLPWRVNEIAADFALIDAWALPAEGSRQDFDDLCDIFASIDPGASGGSMPSRLLFGARTRLGQLLGWDTSVNTLAIPGCKETSLRHRLPADLQAEVGETAGRLPFRPVYRTEDEWALELSNSTVHAILHLGWVPRGNDEYRGQMGIYVKPRGRLGAPYMSFIAPFRHHVVYPALLRRIAKAWSNTSERR
jgi:hypothetical protein